MKYLLLLLLSVTGVFAHEKEVKTRADQFATAQYSSQRFHSWPFPLLSIGHNMQSFQNYGGSPYWHDGLDIRSVIDQPILASAGGKVVNIENYVRGNPLYWEVAILDAEGFVWKYHHVDRRTIPDEIFKAYKSGTEIPSGTFIGNVVRWTVTTYGEVYHHLHLLIVAKDGKYINPYLLMQPLADTRSPYIANIGLAKNHRPVSGNTISGSHSLFVEAYDLTLHDKFLLPPHKISYKLNGGAEKVVWEFIHLPSGTNDTQFINDFYLNGTCGNYHCRKFYFNLNFTPEAPRKTMSLAPGSHQVEVTVEDIAGNKASESFNWTVN
ncbi:MAG: peptidoglycan DD-metalloendopeptidase family protein [Bacteriovoracia bacterium]